jgi:hypothetical protein
MSTHRRRPTPALPIVASNLLGAALLSLSACSGAQDQGSARPHGPIQTRAFIPAELCASNRGGDRATCVTMIGAVRAALGDQRAICGEYDPADLADTYAVMDWVKAHPERQSDDLAGVISEVLQQRHPCS